MNYFNIIGELLGGLGLFILAMKLMTDGLKAAVADRLRGILTKWTATQPRGIATGAAITALVQSSSAVTVATIGFVNAGLLSLTQALGIVFGANVGTTITGWLVSLIGFNLKLEAFALPLIGIGTAIWFIGAQKRFSGYGEALLGFGLFFLGLEVLKGAFDGLAPHVDLQVIADFGLFGIVLLVLAGFLMTVLTQSSSAALAITLTAAAGGVISVQSAAAVVIGANVGTTSTALLASIGATAAAKRVAMAHVVFNGVTALIALVALQVLLQIVGLIETSFLTTGGAAITLALFHTTFNLLGVIVVAPFSGRLAAFLQKRFRTFEEEAGRPQFLDSNVLQTPVLALNAIHEELKRTAGFAHAVALATVARTQPDRKALAGQVAVVERLREVIAAFTADVGRNRLPQETADALAATIAATQNLADVTYLAGQIMDVRQAHARIDDPDLRAGAQQLADALANLLGDAAVDKFTLEKAERNQEALEQSYNAVKRACLGAGVQGRIQPHQLSEALDDFMRMRRLGRRWVRLIARLDQLARAVDKSYDENGLKPPTGPAKSPDGQAASASV